MENQIIHPDNSPEDNSVPVNVVHDSGPHKVKGRKKLDKKKLFVAGLVIVAVIGLVGAGLFGYSRYQDSRQKAKDIVIGDITITPEDRALYAKSIENYKKANNAVSLQGTPEELAIDDLVMNAALKQEAKKNNLSLTDTEIRTIHDIPPDMPISESQSIGPSSNGYDYYKYTTAENTLLRQKLEKALIAERSLSYTSVNFDSPFFNSQKDKEALKKLHQQAKDTLTNDFLPLYEKGATKEEIASKAEANYVNGPQNDQLYKLFFEKMVVGSNYFENYVDKVDNSKYITPEMLTKEGVPEAFKDLENVDYGIPVEGLRNTVDEINKLKKVGDHTGVFASKTGMYMIARLEKATGGSYVNWQDFLDSYKEKYVPKSEQTKKVSLIGEARQKVLASARDAASKLSNMVMPTAEAQPAGGCGSHTITASVTALDIDTGAVLWTQVTASQSSVGCGNGNSVSSDFGYVQMAGNCWGEPVQFSVATPNGYTPAGSFTGAWTPSDVNGTGAYSAFYYFRRIPPPDQCPNIPGIQAQVPAGLTIDDQGNCVTDGGGTGPPGNNNPNDPTCALSVSITGQNPNFSYQVQGTWSSEHNQSQSLSWGGSGKSGTFSDTIYSRKTYTGTFTNTRFNPARSITCTDVADPNPGQNPCQPADYQPGGRCYVAPLPPAFTPYLRVYGNDVIVGSAFSSEEDCNTNPRARIVANSNPIRVDSGPDSNPNLGINVWAGAGGQFAVFDYAGTDRSNPNYGQLRNGISGFISDNMRSRASTPPQNGYAAGSTANDLTFGNYWASSGDLYDDNGPFAGRVSDFGGQSGILQCLPDYYQEVGGSNTSPGSLSAVRADVASPIPDGERKLVVVDGNLYIDRNIEYQNTSWPNVGSIPNVTIIVKGNISIAPNVTRLDGIFIAQPKDDNSAGEIYTCGEGNGPLPLDQIAQACRAKLTINGSFIAKKTLFYRTGGSVVCPSQQDVPENLRFTCRAAAPNESSSSDSIAEVFNFSPEAYMTPLNSRLETSMPFQKYDSITSLPPVL